MPATPASAPEMKKVWKYTSAGFTPSSDATRSLPLTARIWRPKVVLYRYSIITTSRNITITRMMICRNEKRTGPNS